MYPSESEKNMAIELIDTKGVAGQLGINPQTARDLMRTGELQSYRLGNAYKTKQQWIDEYLERQKVVQTVKQ